MQHSSNQKWALAQISEDFDLFRIFLGPGPLDKGSPDPSGSKLTNVRPISLDFCSFRDHFPFFVFVLHLLHLLNLLTLLTPLTLWTLWTMLRVWTVWTMSTVWTVSTVSTVSTMKTTTTATPWIPSPLPALRTEYRPRPEYWLRNR